MSNNLKDPRFLVIATLFTIYGLFIVCIFLFSSGPLFKSVVRRFCGAESDTSEVEGVRGGGVSASRDTEMRVRRSSSENNHNHREGTYYQQLSERSKKRMDQLRQCVVERLLLNYTLTLETEHVVDHQQVERQNMMTAVAAVTSLSASAPTESNEKTRIDAPDATITTAISSSNECAASLSNSTTLSTSTTSLYDDRPDLETGFFEDCSSDIQDNNNNLNNKDEEEEEEEDKQEDYSYTHVLLPFPGFGLDGTCMETLLNKDDEEKCSEKSNSGSGSGSSGNGSEVKRWFMDTFFARRKEEEAGGESSVDDYDNSSNNNLNRSSDDNGDGTASKGTLDTALVHSDIEEATSSSFSSSSSSSSDLQAKQQHDHEHHHHHHRQVPIFCSICLSEYELSQSICWSNNHQCTHVFHTECMIQWLVTLGRKQSLNKRFTRYPTDRELVGFYELQCPCCRQEFVRSDFIEKECCV